VAGVPTKVAVGRLVLCNSFEENTLFATTPPVTETARGLAVDLVLSNGSRLNTGFTVEYRELEKFWLVVGYGVVGLLAVLLVVSYWVMSALAKRTIK